MCHSVAWFVLYSAQTINSLTQCSLLKCSYEILRTEKPCDYDSCLLVQVVLIHVGVTSVIAHIKIGQMHAALESKVLVVSAQGQSTNAQLEHVSYLQRRSRRCRALSVAQMTLKSTYATELLSRKIEYFCWPNKNKKPWGYINFTQNQPLSIYTELLLLFMFKKKPTNNCGQISGWIGFTRNKTYCVILLCSIVII